MTAKTEEYWKRFIDANPEIPPDTTFQAWYFGDAPEMARELAALVVSGKKTATASLLETNRLQPENAPLNDGYSVITGFDGEPVCIIQTAEIRHIPFRNVDAAFAYDEGEGDQTLESWRKVHRAYFERESAKLGFVFSEDSIVCCERFRLLFTK